MRKTCTKKKYHSAGRVKIMKRFQEKATKLVDVGAQYLRGHLKDGYFKGM